jgi:hypothetical protein
MEVINEKINEYGFNLLPIPGGTFMKGNENDIYNPTLTGYPRP